MNDESKKPTVASLFSGVLGFDEGFTRAGFTPIWACEIEKKCQAVIRRHLPNVTIYDDINKLDPRTVQRPDVLIASPPCQDFSVAGKRQSLEGVRGYLSIKCVEFINGLQPDIVCVENVPGWTSARGNAFGWFLGLLVGADTALVPAGNQKWTSAGMVAGPIRVASWTTLDSQFFGVAQRRERLFIVASPRKECSSEVLFERKSIGRNFKTSREKRESLTSATQGGLGGGSESGIQDTSPPLTASGRGTDRAGESRGQDCVIPVVITCLSSHDQSRPESGAVTLIPVVARSLNEERDGYNDGSDQTYIPDVAGTLTHDKKAAGSATGQQAESGQLLAFGGNNTSGQIEVATACNAHGGTGRHDFESETFLVTGPIMSDGKRMPGTQPDDAESLVIQEPIPILEAGARTGHSTTDPRAGIGIGESGDPMFTLQSGKQHAVAYRTSGNCGVMEQGDRTAALNTATDPNQNIVAFTERTRADGRNLECQEDIAYALTNPGAGGRTQERRVAGGFGVRRLTPTECERLQNFPDCWTAFGIDEKGQQVPMSDSARYKMLGNAVTCSVSNWLATRIKQFLTKP